MNDDWPPLPPGVRHALTYHAGPIRSFRPAPHGNHADVTATVTGDRATVFLKAARKLPDADGPEVQSLRTEAKVNPHLGALTPRLLHQVETGGWLALIFERVPGRHPNYSPGSPDLDLLAATIRALQQIPLPAVVQRPVTRRWAELGEDTSPMAGNALLHTDLNAHNIIVRPERTVAVLDWAFAAKGAPWVELGQLIPWLMLAGHTPGDAELWLHRFAAWRHTPAAAITHYARLHATLWDKRAATLHHPWIAPYAAQVRQWAHYRGVR